MLPLGKISLSTHIGLRIVTIIVTIFVQPEKKTFNSFGHSITIYFELKKNTDLDWNSNLPKLVKAVRIRK